MSPHIAAAEGYIDAVLAGADPGRAAGSRAPASDTVATSEASAGPAYPYQVR